MHEAQIHPDNSFLTLTYNDKNLPLDYSVSVREHQLFMKRLRERVGIKLRFFMSAEYTPEKLRPHYHYLIFGYKPSDLQFFQTNKNQNKLYTSKIIENTWDKGFCTVGEVTYQSAAYVARYIMKKIGGEKAAEYYSRIHPITGSLVQVEPEFARMSNRPGIGDAWYQTFKSDIYPSDFCVLEGQRHAVPKFYIKKHEEEERKKVKLRRKLQSNKHRDDQTPARLRVREQVQLARADQLKRTIK